MNFNRRQFDFYDGNSQQRGKNCLLTTLLFYNLLSNDPITNT